MDKLKSLPVKSSEITPERIYLSRRELMKGAGLAAAAAALAACAPRAVSTPAPAGTVGPYPTPTGSMPDLVTPYDAITHFNNYYEFTESKTGVADFAKDFKTSPWQVEVSGLVQKPQTFAIEDLLKDFDQEDRIYRLRCVEGWSMVIPWKGFPLGKLLDRVEPMGSAKYVGFTTINDPDQMPGQSSPLYPWPYHEGLRLDEAMNDLALLVTGMYGKELPPQDGAPLRLAVPWKYGFKSIKAIVKIELVEEQPKTLWSTLAPYEYGFYANVNPDVPHPRWSQTSERRIGEEGRRPTVLFNGYGDQVAQLYTGMDLKKNY